ncbi:uncharacterized protein V6R79_011872 [Siganus canaliculatus]
MRGSTSRDKDVTSRGKVSHVSSQRGPERAPEHLQQLNWQRDQSVTGDAFRPRRSSHRSRVPRGGLLTMDGIEKDVKRIFVSKGRGAPEQPYPEEGPAHSGLAKPRCARKQHLSPNDIHQQRLIAMHHAAQFFLQTHR